MDEPPWKKIKLSLERPYKDDRGDPLPVLLDITPDGQHIYEPHEDPTAKVGENLRRIFVERGHDFFEKHRDASKQPEAAPEDEDAADDQRAIHESTQPMTPEELFKMRMAISPQLHIALGEMSQARDLLSLLLSSTTPSQPSPIPQLPPSVLTATVVTKPPQIPSVHVFNTQLAIGGKDRALRKAADLFKTAAESMEKGQVRGEKYWADALKIRGANWGLIPAPLPPGSATGKGADKTSKDFLVSFGLEQSPALFRRRAIGRMSNLDTSTDALDFPLRQRTRLRVSLTVTDAKGVRHTAYNHVKAPDEDTVEGALKVAQAEVVEQEIFSVLIKEASSLPTASARVSERLIVIEAAHDADLAFELVDSNSIPTATSSDKSALQAECDFIYSVCQLFLLRAHAFTKSHRLGQIGVLQPPAKSIPSPPPILLPIIDLLQYHVFCERVQAELEGMVRALRQAGIPASVDFEAVGESGEQLVAFFQSDTPAKIGGGSLFRIDNQYSLRFALSCPSSFIAHLPQATLSISSISQLSQILVDEVSGCILNSICKIGRELCGSIGATWFVDLPSNRSVGRWGGSAITFSIAFDHDGSLLCIASEMSGENGRMYSSDLTYRPQGCPPLLDWVRQTIQTTLSPP